jgi:hypothetical protein
MRVTLHTEYFSAEENAEVELTYHVTGGLAHFPKFYISNRIHKGDSVELVCRCAMQKLDRPFPIAENDFDENDEMSTVFVIQKIAQQIGVVTSYNHDLPIQKLSDKFLKNNNCLLILEKLSEAWAGYFRIWNDALTFVQFETPLMDHITVSEHDKIHTGFRKQITKVVLSGGGETFERGSGDFSATVCIDSEFASDDLADNLFGRLNGFSYYPVMKTMCKAIAFAPVNSIIEFPFSDSIYGNRFSVNNVKTYPRRSGLYMEMSNNAVREDEWDYSGKTEREIKRLNQLFSELEKGGDEPTPEVDYEPWKHDPDWAAFEAMPHNFYTSVDDNWSADIMVKVISEARTISVTINTNNYYTDRTPVIDWGDSTSEVTTIGLYYNAPGLVIKGQCRITATHTYSENGVYYVHINLRDHQYCNYIMLCPPYNGTPSYKYNPPLIVGWKYHSNSAQLAVNLITDNVVNSYEYFPFFAATKFIQFSDPYIWGYTPIFYNSHWIDFVKAMYNGINSEDDLIV